MKKNKITINHLIIVLLLNTILPSISFSQVKTETTYNPSFLIPYNKNGVWGWCDTLGNIKIKPQFKSVDFFKLKPRNIDTYLYLCKFQDEANKNYYLKPDGSYLFPLIYREVLSSEFQRGFFILENLKFQKGLFSLDLEKLVVPVNYDTLHTFKIDQDYYFFMKKKNAIFFERYNVALNTISKTDFKEIKYIKGHTEEFIMIKNSKNQFGILKGEKVQIISKKEFEKEIELSKQIGTNLSLSCDGCDRNNGEGNATNKSTFSKVGSKTDEGYVILDVYSENYIVSKDNLQGIISEKNNIILPLIYDKVKFNFGGAEAFIMQNNKFGVKFLYSKYPTIQPKYDSIKQVVTCCYDYNFKFNITQKSQQYS